MSKIPRLVPQEPFPGYAYIPGRFPHPTRDPKGHSYGKGLEHIPPPDPDHWEQCRLYLYGIDLFNHGYYYEAHEAWEAVWRACGLKGTTADFLKGLIKLAAAGVKARQGRAQQVRVHVKRAKELFRGVARKLSSRHSRYMGFSLRELIPKNMPKKSVQIMLDFQLRPAGLKR